MVGPNQTPPESQNPDQDQANESSDDFATKLAAVRQDAEDALKAAQTEIEATDEVIDAAARERFRGNIAITIVYLFVTVILAAVIYALWSSNNNTLDQINNLLERYVYPVVLLVLGFYFGARQADSPDPEDT